MIRHFCFSSLLYRKSLAVLLAVTISGCATSEFGRFPKAYPGPRVPEAQVAELSRKQFSRRVTDYWFTHFDGSQIIDGIRPLFSERYDVMPVRNASVLEMLPGPHKVGIGVHWSNGFKDSTDLDFTAVAGKTYTLAIYELSPGEDPATVELSEPFRLGPAPPQVGLILAIFMLPFVLPYVLFAPSEEPPKDRPFNGCCFVWIQDDESRVVLAGVSPKSVKSETAGQQPSND